jgi:hypothetical protein
MLAAPWFDVPITISLAIIGAILALCAFASWIAASIASRKNAKSL